MQELKKRNNNLQLVIWLLPLSILAFSIYNYVEAKNRLKERDENLFESRSARIVSLVNNRISEYFQILKGVQGLFEASDTVTRKDFRKYVEKLEVNKSYPGIMGIGFSKYLLAKEVDSFVEGVRKEGFNNFNIAPPGERDIYTSIIYLEPFQGKNLKAFGFDMYSEPVRRIAMQIARDSNAASITGKVLLLQDKGESEQIGFLAYLPIYQKGVYPSSVEDCRKYIRGYAYNPFRMRDFINGILGDRYKDVQFKIYDGLAILPERLLYSSDPLEKDELEGNATFKKQVTLNVGHHYWTIKFYSKETFASSPTDSQPLLIIVSGFILSLSVFAVLYSYFNLRKSAKRLSITQKLLKQRNAELNRINTDLDNFIYTASHDLKAPISNLEGLIYNLESRFSGKVDNHEKTVLKMMETSILRLKRTINDLADLSKVQKNITEGAETVSFEEVYEDVVEDLQRWIDESNVLIEYEFIVKTVHFPRKDLRSILYNLISNAIKFRSADHTAVVKVRTERIKDDIVLSVEDNGLGISKSQQIKLFGMFKRLHPGKEGTGIGLYIIKRIIENNNGRIEVESDEGKGTIFRVYFCEM